MPLLELVPNLSEGRDAGIIAQVAACFGRPHVELVDVDSSPAANRTVFTVVGEADELTEAAFDAAVLASELLDLRAHRGIHVRMGALDVIPFVPLDAFTARGGTLTDAFAAAREVGDRIGAHGIPVYFYGEAASRPYRRLLHEVRRDGFEGLPARMHDDPPDRGPSVPHPSAGASAVGARDVLVAFNVGLATRDAAVADAIAREIREFRSVRRGPDGRVTRRVPGRFPGVRAVGWYTSDFDCAQVSSNLTAWRTATPAAVFAAVQEEARARGTEAVGCELVGCVPLAALGSPEDAQATIAAATRALGLDRYKPFGPSKVLDLRLPS